MNDYLLLITNACALVTMSYIALKIKNHIESIEVFVAPLCTGLASLFLVLLPESNGLLLFNLSFIPLIMAGLRYGMVTALLSAIIPSLYMVYCVSGFTIELAQSILIPTLLTSFFHKRIYRNGFTSLRPLDSLTISAVLLSLRLTLDLFMDRSIRNDWVLDASTTFIATACILYALIAMYNDENRNWLLQRRLELQANQDVLTRMPNLHSFLNIARRALECRRITILMIDIDNFKNHNDCLGHLQGDQLLCEVGSVLQESIVERDYVARYGGEEFIVLCHESNMGEIEKIAGKLCDSVCRHLFSYHEALPNHQITISIGTSTSRKPNSNLKKLIDQADQALYYSKASGKNTYTLYESISDASNRFA
ncbi:MAG: GGDEF domain-containing protein [Gorillibacterium sp.]|nr:GGDEF domain-containing protein [Gorillibacterium sp.]